ncbi:hypothetical protein BKA70DRAFT_1233157 [Coprinopsis sp. MPI-PUGE-AT-0042]|nr:hypothetical protein BKA70DRAFT_1233157 [Coprinopsis sp. MPI-PUGE-AT-0042]
MTALSLILNDLESTQGVPNCRQDVHSNFSEPYSNNGQSLFLPSTPHPGQQRYNSSFVLYPFPSGAGQLLCSCGSGRLAAGAVDSTKEVDLITGWINEGAFLVPSLLDAFVSSPMYNELNPAVVSHEAESVHEHITTVLPTPEAPDQADKSHGSCIAALLPSTSTAEVLFERPAAETSSRSTRSCIRSNRSRRPNSPKIVKRPACHSCKVKKVRCSSDSKLDISENESCIPCKKAGISCDYSPPLEGSPAFDVALRRRQIREAERKRRPPKAPRAKPRKKRDGVRSARITARSRSVQSEHTSTHSGCKQSIWQQDRLKGNDS